MKPVRPAQPGQSSWISAEFQLPASKFAGRMPSPRARVHKVRLSGSMLSSEMPQELINITYPHVPISPLRRGTRKDIRPDIRYRIRTPPPATASHPTKYHLFVQCHTAPTSPRYSQDSDLFDRKLNNGELKISTFAKRDEFDTIMHALKKREALELTALKMQQALQKNKEQQKPMVLDMTSHKHIGQEKKMVYSRHARNDDLRVHEAQHMKHESIFSPVEPWIHLDHGGLNHDFDFLQRSTTLCHDKNETAKWQFDYTQECNKPKHTGEHRQHPIGESDATGYSMCSECNTIVLKTNTILCRNCGAFPASLELPSTSSSQFSPRNTNGLDLSNIGLYRKEHQYAVGMTKKEHAKAWQFNKDLTASLHKWKSAEENAKRRRKMSGFRHFSGHTPMKKDIGTQHSPRYRSGIDQLRNGYKMLTRRAARGNPRVEAALSMASICPVAVKEFGITGPLPKK